MRRPPGCRCGPAPESSAGCPSPCSLREAVVCKFAIRREPLSLVQIISHKPPSLRLSSCDCPRLGQIAPIRRCHGSHPVCVHQAPLRPRRAGPPGRAAHAPLDDQPDRIRGHAGPDRGAHRPERARGAHRHRAIRSRPAHAHAHAGHGPGLGLGRCAHRPPTGSPDQRLAGPARARSGARESGQHGLSPCQRPARECRYRFGSICSRAPMARVSPRLGAQSARKAGSTASYRAVAKLKILSHQPAFNQTTRCACPGA